MRQIQYHILKFLDDYDNDQLKFDDLTSLLIHQQEQPDKHELKSILNMISKLTSNHHRSPFFIEKILKIIRYIKKDIKQIFSNIEIFNIIKNNQLILLFFIEESIITIDAEIIQIIEKIDNYKEYFKLEIQQTCENDKKEEIPENYHEKRRNGENDSYVCELIRNDNCTDFIILYNKNLISLTMTVPDSIYETNPFLLGKNPTLIEYSAFFGSLDIFTFLRMNNVELKPSLWLYAIHGRNPEIIHILEENKVECNTKIYSECLNEAIKCHHNEFAMYYKNYFNVEVDIHSNYTENEIFYAFHFYNFEFIPDDCKDPFYFIYSVENDYDKFVDYYIKHMKGLNINELKALKLALENNNLDIFNYLLQQPNIEIGSKCFENCDVLEQFTIPSQVTLIGANAFSNCTNLKEIIIPSSVTNIGDNAFHGCKCFEEIIIPSSVTSIGNSIVSGCTSLKSIQIPQNIKKIGILNFQNFISLTEFNIPKSVKAIDEKAFYRCESLSKIEIPSSVTHIAKYAFFGCYRLKEITLSSSTKSIDLLAFKGCGSLKTIKFEKLPKDIESYLFPFCTSLMYRFQFPQFNIKGNTVICEGDYVDININPKDFSDIRVIVLGGSNGEKTDFIKNIIIGNQMVLRPYIKNFDIAGMTIPVTFYDPIESEVFQSLTEIYYRNSDCAIILFDLADKKSFEKAKNTCNSLFNEIGQIPFVLVGYNMELKSQINVEEISNFALEYHAEYIKISTKDYTNIDIFLDTFNNNILYEAFQENYCKKAKKKDIIQISNQGYQQQIFCFLI